MSSNQVLISILKFVIQLFFVNNYTYFLLNATIPISRKHNYHDYVTLRYLIKVSFLSLFKNLFITHPTYNAIMMIL